MGGGSSSTSTLLRRVLPDLAPGVVRVRPHRGAGAALAAPTLEVRNADGELDLATGGWWDATRYFLVARAPSSQLTFDIDLALSQTNDNPVYYIQYAHARACSVMRKLTGAGWRWDPDAALGHLDQLQEEQEAALLRRLF